ncbi:trimeric intracellular cation channel family protein [Bifidobacterium cuniculi]|uniref:Putative integral membrane protein n=1 Tax=Bifidobacterium cuniculi TaxID=1688 RepID=A0A087B4J4_9BIFI|nr:TRIC cation channel family protein [Bifidobacterium cuniculi]KFI65944.1 putative integral membrane protein [Bifidobacterium cuniculi]
METALQTSPFIQGVEYLAIFFCGMGGGLAAVRKQYDMFTIIITAWLTALGGGIIRDVLLGAVPPVGISDRVSVLTALAAGCAVAVFHPEVDKMKWSMLAIDALALGLFAVNGTSKGLMYNTSGMTAVFLGTFTAMGGGLIRDILLNEVPMVIRDRHWYIMPAVLGSMLTVLAWRWQARGAISLQVEMVLDIVIVLLVVAMRICSVAFDWQLPGAVPRSRVHLPAVRFRQVHHRDGTHTIQKASPDGERHEGTR